MATFNQKSFVGGMNLLSKDTALAADQYRIGFNLRNRNDSLDPIPSSIEDKAAPKGLKQGIYTIGKYILVFVKGKAYYRLNTLSGWTNIPTFSMNDSAPRYWLVTLPITTTNYGRVAVPVPTESGGSTLVVSANASINTISIASSFTAASNASGILVQDGINQPQFIYINPVTGLPIARTTQQYSAWAYDSTGVNDKREYVPIGTYMAWYDGILFVVAIDGNNIYRSVSGRPLDFVLNIDENGDKGGDATTTSYSVGVGGITCLRTMSNDSLFVSASGTNVSVAINRTPGAPTLFGEPTFIRTFLFNSTCLSDKCIVDLEGDTTFIDLTGLRSFNAVLQQENEGKNSPFSADIDSVFGKLVQDADHAACITYNNFGLYSMNTIYGYAIVVYDNLLADTTKNITGVYVGLDTQQCSGRAVKQFAKIELDINSLYCITDDDKVLQLYADENKVDEAIVFTGSACSQNPSKEIKPSNFRCVIDNVYEDSEVSHILVVNNRQSGNRQVKSVPYVAPVTPYTGTAVPDNITAQVTNLLFNLSNANQGWKAYSIISWTGGGSLTNLSLEVDESNPLNPPLTQALAQP